MLSFSHTNRERELSAMEEVWKDVIGFVGLYQVSNGGRVRSLDKLDIRKNQTRRLKGKVLKAQLNTNGYYTVCLCDKGNSKIVTVHKLVAEVFLEKRCDSECINHKDGIKTNNKVDNLEWCTYKENNDHAKSNNLNNNIIKLSLEERELVKTSVFPAKFVAKKLSVSHDTINYWKRKHKREGVLV